MKKLIYIPCALLALSFASCKKDYTCTCTSTGSTTASVTTIVEVDKAAAQANCVSTSQTDNTGTYVVTCELSK
jgi:hypothetical protein